MNKTEFKRLFSQRLAEKFAMEVNDASPNELYQTLGSLLTSTYSQNCDRRGKTIEKQNKNRHIIFPLNSYQEKC